MSETTEDEDEQKRITIRIDKKDKDRWEDAVGAGGDWASLSHLIRDSVETALSDDLVTVPASDANSTGENVEVDLGGIEDDISAIRGQIADLNSDVNDVKTMTSFLVDLHGEGVDLTSEVYELLPAVDDDQEMYMQLEDADMEQFEEEDMNRAEDYGCEVDIRAALQAYAPHDVDRAIDELVNTDGLGVHQMTRDGYRFIYRVD